MTGLPFQDDACSVSSRDLQFTLRFSALRKGDDFCFPCDAVGHVDMDLLDERLRNKYFYARALVGRDFWKPMVEAVSLH